MKPAYWNTLILLLSLALLSACAPLASRETFSLDPACPPSPDRILDERGMLRYHACLISLSTQKQAAQKLDAEHVAVERHFDRTGSGADRVKLAMLLAFPDTRFYSPAAALKMLGPSRDDGPRIPAELRDLARFLAASMTRQQVQDDRVRNLEKDLMAEKVRSETLRAKIDSVKDLERTMTQRDEQ